MASPRRKDATTRTTDVWESAALDEFEPAHLTFGSCEKGELGLRAGMGTEVVAI
jgi:hypothetical protein